MKTAVCKIAFGWTLAIVAAGLLASPAWAAGDVLVTTAADGTVRISGGPLVEGPAPVTIDLNAHAAEWVNIKQDKAQITEPAVGGATTGGLAGLLAIPGDKGGNIGFREALAIQEQNLNVNYDIRPAGPVTVWALQVSANLDAETYKGATLKLSEVKTLASPADPATGKAAEYKDADPVALDVLLPVETDPNKWELWNGYCKKIEVVTDKGVPFTLTTPEPYHFIIQDNRKWDNKVFEVRVSFVLQDGGLDLTADKAFRAALQLGFATAPKFAEAK